MFESYFKTILSADTNPERAESRVRVCPSMISVIFPEPDMTPPEQDPSQVTFAPITPWGKQLLKWDSQEVFSRP